MLDHLPSSLQASTSRGLHPDEPVWWLREMIRVDNKTPGAVPMRVQGIQVIRDDKPTWFTRVLGPECFFAGQHLINFMAGALYSVGEVVEIAERLREGKPEAEEPSDLLGDYMKQCDELQAIKAHKTVNGPYLTIQRN